MGNQKYPIGSHLRVPRTRYHHHGVYVGRGKVIHYSGGSSGIFDKGLISTTTLEAFCDGSELSVVVHAEPLPKDQIIARAKGRLHEDSYSVLSNNCEHFANWCVTGQARSDQVRDIILHGIIGSQLKERFE